jgi:prepilin-type N-terminal cleavage/methylation domain-containing protein
MMPTPKLTATGRGCSGYILRGRAGFTLLEVVVAMVIMSILAGSLYSLVKTTIQSSVLLENSIRREQEITGFIDLCQKTFRSLPPGATLEGTFREEGGAQVKALIVRESPKTLSWGDTASSHGISVISAKAQNNGLLSLALSHSLEYESKEARWLQLMSNVQQFQLKFYDPRSGSWNEEWKDPSFRPSLIEMQIKLSEGDRAYRHIFWLPPVSPYGIS